MSPRKRRVAEPVQVYLAAADRQRLERLAEQLDATKSDVLRRGLEALERQLADPAEHPALRVIGIAQEETGPPLDYDVAREHDRFLSDSEIASWSPSRGKRGR
ncbi:MAG: hypothetical protein ACREMR_06055 [Gemmatimonadales bacterium]